MWLSEAETPKGMRLYAIGDVHGCDLLLAKVHDKVAADLAVRPVTDHRVIHVGDYVDRGPDSPAVIERLSERQNRDPRVICLRGNHDDLMRGFLTDPVGYGPTWLANSGTSTLSGYGVAAGRWFLSNQALRDISKRLSAVLPAKHRDFLERLDYSVQIGDFFFCHAGIRPGVPLAKQSPEDLMWIREEFGFDRSDHGVVVIHGHTPMPEPEVQPNRINIDTGAVFSGRLTCVALEGNHHRFL